MTMNVGMIAVVAAGGGIGAVMRYLLATQIGHWLGTGFPSGTFIVNVLGCAVMGALVELMALIWSPSLEMRTFLTVGILGGFTAFSAFSLDTFVLIERQEWVPASLYVVGSVLVSLIGFFAAMRLVRLVVA
jgi:CrcB protein